MSKLFFNTPGCIINRYGYERNSMILYGKKDRPKGTHKKAYNSKATSEEHPPPDSFRIEYPGVITLRELEQALWQDMKELEQLNVQLIDNGKLYLPLVNEYGETIWLRDHNGRTPRTWTSRAYHSLATDYRL